MQLVVYCDLCVDSDRLSSWWHMRSMLTLSHFLSLDLATAQLNSRRQRLSFIARCHRDCNPFNSPPLARSYSAALPFTSWQRPQLVIVQQAVDLARSGLARALCLPATTLRAPVDHSPRSMMMLMRAYRAGVPLQPALVWLRLIGGVDWLGGLFWLGLLCGAVCTISSPP